MGLDISYYMQAKRLRPITEDCDWDEEFTVHPQTTHFVKQADGLEYGTYKAADRGGFGCGAYSSYGRWRDKLAVLVGHKSAEDAWAKEVAGQDSGPFWELINFFDNEGVIGAETSKKLATDFSEWQSAADEHEDEGFRHMYAKWREAFDMAAQDGLVVFH